MLTSLKRKINKTYTSIPSTYRDTDKSTSNLNSYFNNNIGEPVHNSPASKEWFNNVYSYNKNFVKTLPSTDSLVNRLVKSYFNLDKLKNQKKSKKIQVRFKRLSLNRIVVSRAEINHTNNKVNIFVYFYNRNKKIFLYKLKNLYKTLLFKKISTLKKTFTLKSKPVINSKVKYGSEKYKNNLPTLKNRVFSSRRFKNSNITRKIRKAYCRLFSEKKIRNINRLIFSLHTVNRKSKSLLKKNYFLTSLPKLLNGHSNNISNNYLVYFINWPENSLNILRNKKTSLVALQGNDTNNLHKISDNKNLFFTSKVNKKRELISYENIFSKNTIKSVNRSKKHFLLYKLRNLHRLILLFYNFNNKSALSEKVYLKNLISINIPKVLRKSKNSLISPMLSKKQETKLIKKINYITIKSLRILKKVRKHKRFLLKILKWNKTNFRNYENKYYNDYLNKSYKKEILYLYYVRMLSLNNNKFKNWFLTGLNSLISKVYKKKVEFNFVSLKYLHLNSDIFSESISVKLKNRKNRLLRVLKKALFLVKLPSIQKSSIVSTLMDKDNKEENKYYKQILGKNNIERTILDNIKYKTINGVRLEAAGRLSKRLTASRSVFKLKYKGSLKNTDSSYNGLSSVMLRGHIKPNLQYTNISSKTRNGSFGLKGWVSSY